MMTSKSDMERRRTLVGDIYPGYMDFVIKQHTVVDRGMMAARAFYRKRIS